MTTARRTGATVTGPDYARRVTASTPWAAAREILHNAGRAAAPQVLEVPLAEADGLTLAEPLVTLTDLPPFPTSSVDGWAVRGPGPWLVTGRVLAGEAPDPLAADGTCVEIATGAMVPEGTTTIVRIEDATVTGDPVGDGTVTGGTVSGVPRAPKEWRDPGEEAARGEELLPAGTPVDPGVIGLAAACGYDAIRVRPAPAAAVVVFGDELLTAGRPAGGRIRDALGPSLPAWLRRLGARPLPGYAPCGPVADTLDAHVTAIRGAFDAGAELVCTTGGTMRGPVDHLHPALAELGAEYLVDTVAVRPGFPMLAARLPGDRYLVGLPGNPQSAVVALVSLVAPLLAGLTGRPLPPLGRITPAAEIRGRGPATHLALVDPAGTPVRHTGSAMLRGLAGAVGFAAVPPGTTAPPGAETPLVPLPLLAGERP